MHVFPRIDKFGRCRVNRQLFSSDYNSTDRGALVKVMFVMNDTNELHLYFGVVRFYFQIYIKHKNDTGKLQNCTLAYVTWMVFKSPEKDKLSDLYLVNDTFYQRDKIISPRKFISRCTLVRGEKKSSYYVANLPEM